MPRFNRRGQEKVYFALTATKAAPTAAQITAAVEITGGIRALTGFTSQQEDLDAADMSDTWGKTIPGGQSTVESSITFYAGDDDDDLEEDIRAALVEGTNGYVIFSKRGAATTGVPVNVFPVRVKAVNDDETAENATATFTAGFALYDPPAKGVDVVA